MHGTVNELCARLMQRFKFDELMTLISCSKSAGRQSDAIQAALRRTYLAINQ